MNSSATPVGGLRGSLEARWLPSQRIEKTCAAAGALIGIISFGYFPLWLLLFPLGMVTTIKKISRWGWLPAIYDTEARRHRLTFFYLAPLSWLLFVFLLFLRLPVAPFLFLGTFAGIPLLALFALMYVAPQALALKRFTGVTYRGLIAQSAVLIAALYAIDALISESTSDLSQRLWFWLVSWALAVIILRRAGAVFGLWLVRPNPTPPAPDSVLAPLTQRK